MIVFRDRFTDIPVGKAPWLLYEGDLYLGKVGENHASLASKHSEDPKKMLYEAVWGTVFMDNHEPSGEVFFATKASRETKKEIKQAFANAKQELPAVKWS